MDAVGLGIIAPIVPNLVEKLGHLPAQDAAPWVGALIAVYATMQFLAAPLLGELSDHFGRRTVILASVLGLGCDYILLAFAPNLWWLFLGRVVAGATSANVTAATAYIADVAGEEDRAKLFGLIGATFGAGFVVGPAIGGVLGGFWLRLPFVVAAALALLNAGFGLFVLPESLPDDRRRPIDWGRTNPFRRLAGLTRDRSLGRMALAWSCSWIGLGAVQSSLVLFTAYRFHWGPALSGLALAGIGLSQALVEGVLLRYVVAAIGERRSALLGYAAGTAGYALLAVAFMSWLIAPAVALIALGGLALPSLRTMVSTRDKGNNQGQLQGALSSVEGLTAVAAPLVAAGLFYGFTSPAVGLQFAGAPFVLAAAAAAAAGFILRTM